MIFIFRSCWSCETGEPTPHAAPWRRKVWSRLPDYPAWSHLAQLREVGNRHFHILTACSFCWSSSRRDAGRWWRGRAGAAFSMSRRTRRGRSRPAAWGCGRESCHGASSSLMTYTWGHETVKLSYVSIQLPSSLAYLTWRQWPRVWCLLFLACQTQVKHWNKIVEVSRFVTKRIIPLPQLTESTAVSSLTTA